MTSNLEKRVKEHNSNSSKGAKYLRAKKPVITVYSETFLDIKTAMNRELQVKKWSKAKKEALIKGDLELLKKLYLTSLSEIEGLKNYIKLNNGDKNSNFSFNSDIKPP